MNQLERELLRILVTAEGSAAEALDPEDTKSVLEAIAGREDVVRREFDRLVATDTVVLGLLWRLCLYPPPD